MDSEMGLSGKTVLVVGTGISGIAAVNLLATQSAGHSYMRCSCVNLRTLTSFRI